MTHGITGAISLEGPKDHDLQLTTQLEKYMAENDVFEDAKESELRQVVLGKLHALVRDWVKEVSRRKVCLCCSHGRGVVVSADTGRRCVATEYARVDD